MKLQTAVYTARRGYAWSRIPEGVSPEVLDIFIRRILAERGDFPDPELVESGMVSDGRVAAAFTMRNVPAWDANGRAADYGAFAFFPAVLARLFDFVELTGDPFFSVPMQNPADSIFYSGPAALNHAGVAAAPHRLDPRMIGALVAACAARSQPCLVTVKGGVASASPLDS